MTAPEADGRTGRGRAGYVISREIWVMTADSAGSNSGTSVSRITDDEGAPWSRRVILPAGTELTKKSTRATANCGLRVVGAALSRIGGKEPPILGPARAGPRHRKRRACRRSRTHLAVAAAKRAGGSVRICR